MELSWGPSSQLSFERKAGGVIEITLEAGNPHFWTGVINEAYDPAELPILAFDCFSPTGLESVSVRFRSVDGSIAFGGSKNLPMAETWQPFSIDLREAAAQPGVGREDMRFHLSMKGKAGTTLQIRGMKLRAPTAEEERLAATREATRRSRQADARAYLEYLRAEYPASIDTVHVGKKVITLIGRTEEAAEVVGFGPHLASHQAVAGEAVAKVKGRFRIDVARFAEEGGADRAVWRWRLRSSSKGFLTPCRWPTVEGPHLAPDLPVLETTHPKGLGGMPIVDRDDHEIFELGIQHATVNQVLTSVLRTEPGAGTRPWKFEGRTYHVNERALQGRDATVKRLSDRDIVVTCILLVGNRRDAMGVPNSVMTHPEAESRGIYSMPNLTTEESTHLYRATMAFLIERYTRPDGRYGWIRNWVLHNEINQAGTWTNMGDQPLARYLESYMRSARIVYHTARNHDPHARVFVSLTHHWAKQSSGVGTYVVRDLIDLFAEMARVEGDFEWGVAYHPYPQNLRDPDTWNDSEVQDDFDTPYITPKNLQVLPRYLAQPRFLYRGTLRGILLSEQGFNSPTLSVEDQRRQVAGIVYLFRKLDELPMIEAFHLHRYQDMPEGEGGLRFGLVTETGERKLGWEAYRAIGTPEVEEWERLADEVIADRSRESAE